MFGPVLVSRQFATLVHLHRVSAEWFNTAAVDASQKGDLPAFVSPPTIADLETLTTNMHNRTRGYELDVLFIDIDTDMALEAVG